jgi:formate hydrogenlyase subunit 6/NADH:ubiquinone oxidoreductase subunit I
MHSLVRRPVTEQIPVAPPARLRGALEWTAEGCTGCALCAKDCPADAIELIRLDERGKRFIIRYSVDRCTFCGQCVENCRPACLRMSGGEWSLAAPTRDGYTVYFGNEADVRQYLAEHAANGASAPGTSSESGGAGDRS